VVSSLFLCTRIAALSSRSPKLNLSQLSGRMMMSLAA
jgi:hypothetical protein